MITQLILGLILRSYATLSPEVMQDENLYRRSLIWNLMVIMGMLNVAASLIIIAWRHL